WIGVRENLPERLDRLIGEERMPPVVVAFPDCFTRLGGNQYINYINSASAWSMPIGAPSLVTRGGAPAAETATGCAAVRVLTRDGEIRLAAALAAPVSSRHLNRGQVALVTCLDFF